VCVAGQIDVVDAGSFKHGGVLQPNVRREQEDTVGAVFGRQSRAPPDHLVGDDCRVLEPQVPLLFDEIAAFTLADVEGEDGVKGGRPGRRAELALRHPCPEEASVWLKIRERFSPRHVLNNIHY